MKNPSIRKTSLGAALLLPILAITLSACLNFGAGETPDRAVRPDATSTPPPNIEGSSTPIPQPQAEAFSDSGQGQGGIDLASMTTEEQLQAVIVPTSDLNQLALRLRPGVDILPTPPTQPVVHEVGDEVGFWVHNTQINSTSRITAELIYRTDVVYAWVETGTTFEREKIAASMERFTNDIYPASVEFFGHEAKPGVDGDNRLHILHSVGTGSGVAGYFNSSDQYFRVANPYSNEKEMFYISLNWLNGLQNYERYESVLAHELQHMIHWNNDRNEASWVNEGLSEFSKEVTGFGPVTSFLGAYGNSPETQLNTWNESGTSNTEHYGGSYLFVTYFAQRYGSDLTKALVAAPANGTSGFTQVLQAAGIDNDFDSLFGQWIVANYVDDPFAMGMDGVYGYEHLNSSEPSLAVTHSDFPVPVQEAEANNYGVDYILLQGEGDVTVRFEGQRRTQLARTSATSGTHAWWSNRGDEMDARLTRQFDLTSLLPGTPVQLSAQMWWDIEEGYDYGYALASQDGQKWQILDGTYTTLENPSGASFGAAYNARSGSGSEGAEWVTETYDLSDYAGEVIWVRFEYVTDGAVNMPGWFIDDIQIPAISYISDFENGSDEWQSEGWLLTDNQLPQHWLVQIFTLQDNVLQEVKQIPLDDDRIGSMMIPGLGSGKTAVITVSGTTPVTTESARYRYWVE
ncbi:MAG: hypothetical protein AAF702_47145 [Chloroflexota bacterium]